MSLRIFVDSGLHLGLSRLAPMHDISQSEYISFPLDSCSYKPVATLPQPQIPIFNLVIVNLICSRALLGKDILEVTLH